MNPEPHRSRQSTAALEAMRVTGVTQDLLRCSVYRDRLVRDNGWLAARVPDAE